MSGSRMYTIVLLNRDYMVLTGLVYMTLGPINILKDAFQIQ